MTAFESMAVLRLRQWAVSRAALLNGRGHPPIQRLGWVERRARDLDATNTRVIDFEKAFDTLPLAAQLLLVAKYRDHLSMADTAAACGISERSAHEDLHSARLLLANALDRRHLL